MEVGVERLGSDAACIKIAGTVGMGKPAELESLLAELLADGARRFVIDLADVPFLNSKLLDTLVRLSAQIDPHEGGVAVLTSQEYVRHMLEVTEEGGLLLLEDSRDAALVALGAAPTA